MFSGHCNHFLHILHVPASLCPWDLFFWSRITYLCLWNIDIFLSLFQDESAFHGFTEEKITFFCQKADEKSTMFEELIQEVCKCVINLYILLHFFTGFLKCNLSLIYICIFFCQYRRIHFMVLLMKKSIMLQ